ncbi:MAG: DUF4268 domain-containing protein [Euryarchaeota archaeon]|nr:DUF4268 domain-containing protein [Euryarchaeota archaeon]
MDILAEEENTGKKIVIENQLEATDHSHLGKIITYASGYDAEIIIWIVKKARDEHRQAIDWLNDRTDEDTNFFIVKIEVWQIGDSPYAPKFQIVSEPNDWAKAVKNYTKGTELTKTKMKQLDFWNNFKEYTQEKSTTLRLRKTHPRHWYTISIGSSDARISLTVNTQKNLLECTLYIPHSKELFDGLKGQKEDIEKELGEELEWMELPDKKACRIKISRDGYIDETDEWKEYFEWLKTEAEKFQRVFSRYIKKF